MVIESAQLPITAGREEEFEQAMVRGREVIENAPGSGKIMLTRGVENPSSYVLLVEWDSVESHQKAVEDETFLELRDLARSFYDGKPIVQHFTTLQGGGLG